MVGLFYGIANAYADPCDDLLASVKANGICPTDEGLGDYVCKSAEEFITLGHLRARGHAFRVCSRSPEPPPAARRGRLRRRPWIAAAGRGGPPARSRCRPRSRRPR